MIRLCPVFHAEGDRLLSLAAICFSFAVFSAPVMIGCGAGCANQGVPETPRQNEAPASAGDADSPGRVVDELPKKTQTPVFPLSEVGRLIESRNLEQAAKLLEPHVEDSDESRFLASRIAREQGRFADQAALLKRVAFTDALVELGRRVELLEALQNFDPDACVAEATAIAGSDLSLTRYRKRELSRTRAECLLALKRLDEAATAFAQAASLADGKVAEGLRLEEASAMGLAGKRDAAIRLLKPMAFQSSSAATMERALKGLADLKAEPKWTAEEQLTRIDRLLELKGWDAADRMIDRLLPSLKGAAKGELLWKRAKMMFDRRGHHAEALTGAQEIIASGGVHSEEARFLKARALSRLDRDEEAITAYRELAKRKVAPGLRDEALFAAARLEFYLGKHTQARGALEKLVGNGDVKQKNRSLLSADQIRDAHFISGMCALLENVPAKAIPHFSAASAGSSNEDALERNRYWLATAQFSDKKTSSIGAAALLKICAEDPTSWYALFAARRLSSAGAEHGACIILPSTAGAPATAAAPVETAPSGNEIPARSLADLSARAAFWAGMGLFKEASAALDEAEKSSGDKGDPRDWIIHYNRLDAPQHAIRRASIGLDWTLRDASLWRAQSAYPRPYSEIVSRETERHPLPPNLIYSIARKESLFDPHAVSYVGAMGMMQMMPATWETNRRRAGLPELKNGEMPGPEDSIIAGGFELSWLLKRYQGSLPLCIMAYNAGPNAVTRWLVRSGDSSMDVFVEKASFGQTRNYVRRVYQNLVRYAQLYRTEFPVLPETLPSAPSGVPEDSAAPVEEE